MMFVHSLLFAALLFPAPNALQPTPLPANYIRVDAPRRGAPGD